MKKHSVGRMLLTLLIVLSLGTTALAQVTIEFSGWPTDERMGPIVERFHQEYPDIRVQLTLQGPAAVMTRIFGGAPPTVFRVSWAELADVVETGAVIDLQPYIDRDRVALDLDDFWPPTLASGRHNGVQWAMPMNVGGNLTFVNMDHINAAGLGFDPQTWTYGDFAEMAQRTSRDINGDGVPDIWGYSGVNNWAFWTGLIFSNGGGLYNADGTRFHVDTPIVADSLRYIEDLVNRRQGAPAIGAGNPSFTAGQATFWLGSAPNAHTMGDTGFQWAVVPNPRGSERRVMMGGNQPLLISAEATPEEREAAWKLITFIGRAEIQSWFADNGWNAPTRISTIPYIENEHMRVFALELENQVQHTNRLHNQIVSTFNNHISQVLSGQMSPEAAATQINHELNATLDHALGR